MTKPTFIQPMAAKLATVLPEAVEWIYEVKWDGYRVEGIKDGDKVQLLSRNEKNLSADFPGVVESISRINAQSAVLDGEVISVDDQGRASFQNLQKRSRRSPG